MAQITNFFHYPNVTEALNPNPRTGVVNKFEVVKVNKFGNFRKRFSNFSGPIERFNGFRNGLIFGQHGNSLVVIDISSGKEQTVFQDSERFALAGSSFHRKEDLIFFGIFKENTTSIFSSKFDGSERKLIYKLNEILYVFDVCEEGKHLFVAKIDLPRNRSSTMDTVSNMLNIFYPRSFESLNLPHFQEPELVTISIEKGKLEPITLAKNKIRGLSPSLNQDGSLLAFSKVTGSVNQIFIVDWEKKRNNRTKKKLENLKKAEVSKHKKSKKHSKNNEAEEEKHLKNVRQLTFGGQNAEGYFALVRFFTTYLI